MNMTQACPGGRGKGRGRGMEKEGKRKGKGRGIGMEIFVASQPRPLVDNSPIENSLPAKQADEHRGQPPPQAEQIAHVFAHWQTTMHHPQAKLDDKRKRLIARALKSGYSVAQLCQAIEGCSLTPHNIGDNDRGQRYDGLHIILRDGDQIDRFIHNCHSPPKALSEADRRINANVRNLQDWVNKKMHDEEVIYEQN